MEEAERNRLVVGRRQTEAGQSGDDDVGGCGLCG